MIELKWHSQLLRKILKPTCFSASANKNTPILISALSNQTDQLKENIYLQELWEGAEPLSRRGGEDYNKIEEHIIKNNRDKDKSTTAAVMMTGAIRKSSVVL